MSDPTVTTLIVEDGVDSSLDIQVKILDHRVTDDPEERILHLSYQGAEPGRGFSVEIGALRRILAAIDEGGEKCGAWGGCPLPKGHNMGQADIPENHQGMRRTT